MERILERKINTTFLQKRHQRDFEEFYGEKIDRVNGK